MKRTAGSPGLRLLPGGSAAARPLVPLAVQVLVGVGATVLLLLALVSAPVERLVPGTRAVVGELELVQLTGPSGLAVQTLARVDTGALSSSIDDDLAAQLGFTLRDADVVTVVSDVGSERRPEVPVTLRLAGASRSAIVTVDDRGDRDTSVLLGRSHLGDLQVAVGERELTSPGSGGAPSVLDVLTTDTPLLSARSLLALLPLTALLIVVLRVVVGLRTLGTFSPILLALGHAQAGIVVGVGLTAAMLAAGLAAQPLLRRLRLPRVARLAVLVGVVSALLLGFQSLAADGGGRSWGATLPVVVTAVIIERLWEVWDLDGAADAAKEAAVTLAVSVAVAVLLMSPALRYAAATAPATLALCSAVLAGVVGTYRGLRLSELGRFRAAAVVAGPSAA